MKVVLGILIFMSAIACFAQEMPEPALTETIPDASTCDGMKTYVDLFALKMQERPASTGLIVITPDQNRPEDRRSKLKPGALRRKGVQLPDWFQADSSSLRLCASAPLRETLLEIPLTGLGIDFIREMAERKMFAR